MARKKRKPSKNSIWIGSAVLIVAIVLVFGLLVKLLLTDTVQQKKRQTHQVKLLKPPKPPEVKEKPPPPKKKEKKEIKQKVKEKKPEPKKQQADKKPPQSENLGVDAKGEAGSDSFGLEAREGGSPLIGSGGSESLMQKYGWYNQLVEKTIKARMDEIFEKQGGMPREDLRTVVDLFLNEQGRIVRFDIHKSSGNEKMDQVVKEALEAVRIRKEPPEGMPRGMRLTIAARS